VELLKKSFNATKWQTIALVVNFVTNTLVVGVLARLLFPEDFGVIAIANTVINLTSMIADVGVGQYIIREPNVDRTCIQAVITTTFLIGLIYIIALSIAAPFVARFYKMPQLTALIIIIALSVAIRKIGLISQNLLYKELRFKEVAITDIISYVVGYGIIGIIMALLGCGVYSLVIALLLKATLHTVMTYCLSPHTLVPSKDKKKILEVLKFGGGVMTLSMAGSVAYQAPALIMGKILPSAQVGFYDRAMTYAIYPVTATGSIFDKVFYSAAAKLNANGGSDKQAGDIFLKLITILALPGFIGSAILIVGAEDFIRILLGENWLDVVPIFQIICMSIYFRIIVGFTDAVYKLKNILYKATGIRIVYAASVVITVLVLALTTKNLVIICIGINIAVLLNYILSLFLVKQKLKIMFYDCIIVTVKYLFVSVVGAFLYYYVRVTIMKLFYNCVAFAVLDLVLLPILAILTLFIFFHSDFKKLKNKVLELKNNLNSKNV